MKNKIISFLILTLVLLSFPLPAFAQREIADFNYQYEQYRKIYSEYETAKNEFLKFQTLNSSNNAIAATQKMLVQRSQVFRTYFLALKYKLRTTEGVTNSEKDDLSAQLDDEIGWLENHMDTIQDFPSPTLSDLFEASKRFENKEDEYRFFGYQSTAVILVGKIRNLHQKLLNINSSLKPYVERAKIDYLNNWYKEAEDQIYKAREGVTVAELMMGDLAQNSNNENTTLENFGQIQKTLNTAKNFLTKALGFQKEIIMDLDKNSSIIEEVPVASDSSQLQNNNEATASGQN